MTDLTTRIQRVFELSERNGLNMVGSNVSADIIRELCGLLGEAYGALAEGKHYTYLNERAQEDSNFRELAADALSKLEPLKALWGGE